MKQNAKGSPLRTAVCVLVLIFGVINLFTGALALFAGGLGILGVWVWLSLALLGVVMVGGAICVLTGRLPERWRLISLVMITLALASFFASLFYRGFAMSNMFNIVVGFVFLSYAK